MPARVGNTYIHASFAALMNLRTLSGSLRPGDNSSREQASTPQGSLAMIAASHDWNWSESERLYRRAIALDPNYATAHHWFAVDLLSPLGRFEEARTELEIARRLNPLSAIIAEGRVLQLLLQRRYDEALQETKGVLELDPNFYMAHSDMGRILALTGRYKDAVDKYEQARRLSRLLTPKVEGGYAQALALAGRRDLMSLTVPRTGRTPDTVSPYVFHGGTYNGTPIALAAGLATLNVLEEPGALDRLDQRAADLRDGLTALASRHGVPLQVLGRGSVVDFYFADAPIRSSRDVWASDLPRRRTLDYRLLVDGIYNAPAHRYHLSLAHSEADVAETLERIERALTA